MHRPFRTTTTTTWLVLTESRWVFFLFFCDDETNMSGHSSVYHSVYEDRNQLAGRGSDLSNYYYFTDGLTAAEIDTILTLGGPSKPGTVGATTDVSYRSSEIKWVEAAPPWLYEKLARCVRKANEELWHFDVVGFGESLQIGTYSSDSKGHYDWHMDCGKRSCCRKISLTVQLTNEAEYEGGELQFFYSRKTRVAPKKKGTVVLFPSCLMHRVTPVTSGVRQSMVAWITGPPFR